jgi:hypothetical protein
MRLLASVPIVVAILLHISWSHAYLHEQLSELRSSISYARVLFIAHCGIGILFHGWKCIADSDHQVRDGFYRQGDCCKMHDFGALDTFGVIRSQAIAGRIGASVLGHIKLPQVAAEVETR